MARSGSLELASRSASRRDLVTAGADERLALVESLLKSDEAAECAERSLEWLGKHAALKEGLCLTIDPEGLRLVALAAHGISASEIVDLSVDLEDHPHPLVRALSKPTPGALSTKDAGQHNWLEKLLAGTSYKVFPLRGKDEAEEITIGLLLTSPALPATNREVQWVVSLLSPRLVRLHSSRILAEARRQLRRERALLFSIINAMSDPVMLTDGEGRMLISNARAENLFASREGESEGRRRAVALNNMLFSSALTQRVIDDKGSRRELLLVDPSDGSDLLFELMSTGASDLQEDIAVVSILRNVTDLRSATEQIEENYRKLRIAETTVRAERDRLDLIIDSVADPIVVTDPSGGTVLMNVPAERLFTAAPDASAEEAQRVRANDAHFSSFVSSLYIAGDELRRQGNIGLVDPRTGVPLPVEAISGKILSEHGEVTAVVTILHDQTEAVEKAKLYEQLKRASDELEERIREATIELVRQNELLQRQHIELEHASALKSQFLANMSHEFRTPLNAILGYTNMLVQGVSGEVLPQQKRSLSRVDANARHLISIVNDILDISRIEAGKMPVHLDRFKLSDLIDEVITEVEPLIIRSKLEVTKAVPSTLPLVTSDRQKVKQILTNLFSNALKFTPNGSVKISAAYDHATRQFSIAVKDTGIGIAPEDQVRIFEDFSQADSSTTREYGGTGLGLSICRRLAVMLKGQIVVNSKLGEGSTFTLILPRRPGRR